jgi:glycosyltransferase involved in cell wall biosynthesis
MARTDGLVTYSERLAARDRESFAFPEERLRVIPPGIKPYDGPVKDLRAELGIAPDECVIGVIGRLKPDRGYDIILRAFAMLRSRVNRVKLVVVGRQLPDRDERHETAQGTWHREGRRDRRVPHRRLFLDDIHLRSLHHDARRE